MRASNIGFVSTRFAGTDGVSLEASKWAEVFENNGNHCYWMAGELDKGDQISFQLPEAHFKYEQNQWINSQIFGKKRRNPNVTEKIHALRSYLKINLHQFIEQFNLDLLVAENALTIPMHIPLGLALAETIAETQIPTIAHHHDFYWERARFSANAVGDYLRMAFPPNLPNIEHVVINSIAQEELAHRAGISATIIPNVIDFEHPTEIDNDRCQAFRDAIGLKPGEKIVLQPTRVVQRKGIEHAIELVQALKDDRLKLVISHEAGDEGFEYADRVKEYAKMHKVDLRFVETDWKMVWACEQNHPTCISLEDAYMAADFITYPSLNEGFGNAFLEAIYFKKPILINRYAIFAKDIEPKGFDLVVMDGFLTKKIFKEVEEILNSPLRKEQMVNHNYRIANRHYSYHLLEEQLVPLLDRLANTSDRPLANASQIQKPRNIQPVRNSQVQATV